MVHTQRVDTACARRRIRAVISSPSRRLFVGVAGVLAILCLVGLVGPTVTAADTSTGVTTGADTETSLIAGETESTNAFTTGVGESPTAETSSPTVGIDRRGFLDDGDRGGPIRNADDTATGSFGQSVYTTPAGDLVEMDISVDVGDPGYVVVGGDQLSDGTATGFLDILRVDGDVTVTVNTRLLGTDAPTEDVYATDGGSLRSYAHGADEGPKTQRNETAFAGLAFEGENGEEYESLAELRSAVGVGSNPAPLVPQRYRLLVGHGDTLTVNDGTIHLEHRLDRADLQLTTPEFRERVDVYTALDDDIDGAESVDDLLGPARERNEITSGDRVILGFEATGIWGALAWHADDPIESSGDLSADTLYDLTTGESGEVRGEGVSLTVRQTNPGRNEDTTELVLGDADADDVGVRYDAPEDLHNHGDGPTPGAFYLVLDTADSGAFTGSLDPGDEYEVTFELAGVEGDSYRFDRSDTGAAAPFAAASVDNPNVDEQFPYRGLTEGSVSTTASFSIRERSMTFDDRTDDGVVLGENGTTVTLTGNTTLHPESDLTAEFVADTGETSTVETRPIEIGENDTFMTRAVLSGVPAGSPVSLDVLEGSSLYDSHSMVIVDDANDPAPVTVDNATRNVTVIQGDTLGALTVDLSNDGHVDGVEQLSLSVDNGTLTDERRIRVSPDRVSTVGFSRVTVDLPPGEYPYSVGVDGDEPNGTLVVAPGPGSERSGQDDDPDRDTDDEPTENADETDADGQTAADEGTDADGPAPDEASVDDAAGDTANDTGDDGATDPAEESGEDGDPAETSGAVPLPFGIGTREAFGGTIVVGAMYVAGHWV